MNVRNNRSQEVKVLTVLDRMHYIKTFSLSLCYALSLFSEIVWLHLAVTPSIGLGNKQRIFVSNALLIWNYLDSGRRIRETA